MNTRCRVIVDSGWFQNSVLAVILLNASLLGLETSPGLRATHGWIFGWLNLGIQAAFVVELAVRLTAHWPRLSGFFGNGWNVFDFAVVGASFLPEVGPFAMVARVARVLRVTRLLSALPELRLIVGTMLRSIPSMGHVILLLALLLYVYGILGHSMFHEYDAKHWGTLGASVLTLFQILTLEGWVEIQTISLAISPWAWLYYASFIVIAVFVVINLFIAVVINNLEAAKKELSAAHGPQDSVCDLLKRVQALKADLSELERQLERTNYASAIQRQPTADRSLGVFP